MTSIAFTKAHGAGNDFLIIAGEPESLLPDAGARRRICDRRFGVGADGIVFIGMPSRNADVDAELRIFNRDGGEVEISGNGTRCAAAWLMQQQGKSELRLATRSGVKTLRLISRTGNQFVLETEMGQPILSPAMIPFHPPSSPPDPILAFELPLSGGTQRITVTSMGNPHCSIAVENFDWDWRAAGREIEHHRFFPQRTNVEFYRPVSRDAIEVRFWERGVGETMSSGTGSCAAAVAASLNGYTSRDVRLLTQAGELAVQWHSEGILLTGPAEIICTGNYFTGD